MSCMNCRKVSTAASIASLSGPVKADSHPVSRFQPTVATVLSLVICLKNEKLESLSTLALNSARRSLNSIGVWSSSA